MKTIKWILVEEKPDCFVYYFVLSDGKEGFHIEYK